MLVVSDTTLIISLIKIDQLSLLSKMFGEILIPEAVYRELTENQAFTNESKIIKESDFFKINGIASKE